MDCRLEQRRIVLPDDDTESLALRTEPLTGGKAENAGHGFRPLGVAPFVDVLRVIAPQGLDLVGNLLGLLKRHVERDVVRPRRKRPARADDVVDEARGAGGAPAVIARDVVQPVDELGARPGQRRLTGPGARPPFGEGRVIVGCTLVGRRRHQPVLRDLYACSRTHCRRKRLRIGPENRDVAAHPKITPRLRALAKRRRPSFASRSRTY